MRSSRRKHHNATGRMSRELAFIEHVAHTDVEHPCDDRYAFALREGKARWIERAIARGLLGRVLQRLEGRTQAAFIAKRTELRAGKRKLRIDGKHTLALGDAPRKRVKWFMRDFATRLPYPEFFKVLDVARRIAGTGSLGLER